MASVAVAVRAGYLTAPGPRCRAAARRQSWHSLLRHPPRISPERKVAGKCMIDPMRRAARWVHERV